MAERGDRRQELFSLKNFSHILYRSVQHVLQSTLKAIDGVTRTSGTKVVGKRGHVTDGHHTC